ncbi:hypothetical protein AAE02nite_49200 [Adhaeribacter aerolatus]|uniref:Uncharacterized protein n=1 Tax=Adhaeribacter aerolatus TaxID=670289 RepID=A0A512B5K8_9BACT|nr:DUF6528 family protein [Adhaeribacter aerolatus]GEO07256.1 hypothetical protein AAE02nite_49200 [Adhaeribacter aerolatus]
MKEISKIKYSAFTLLTLLILGMASFVSRPFAPSQELLVCGDSQVLIVDYLKSKDSIPAVVWRWDAREVKELPEKYRTSYFKSVDDSKSVAGGKQILISSSSGGVALVNRADKKLLFYAHVPNAHSIELLPNNRVVVAGSTAKGGNCVALFNISQPEKVIFRDSLYSGHGVVWDTKRQKLYALGYDQLRQYILQDWNSTSPKLKLEKKWKIPGLSGHDLQLSPDGNALFLTEHDNPWIFNLKTAEFTKLPELAGTANVKSFGKHPQTGQLIFTIPEESWWTYHVKFLNPTRSLAFPGMHVYKARWVENK